MQIPVLDLSPFLNDKDSLPALASKLDSALSKCGFVHLINHGLNPDLIANTFSSSASFFALNESLKTTVETTEATQQGFVSQGREVFDQSEDGSKATHELREAYDVTSIDEEALFPDKLAPALRANLTPLAEATRALGMLVLRALALALGQDKDYLTGRHTRVLGRNNWSKIRSLYYPPVEASQVKPGVVRCGEHSDYGTITFLFQVKKINEQNRFTSSRSTRKRYFRLNSQKTANS